MKIKSMTATFGKLDHARLELEDGLNLIQAPNEGGKSTWAAFWRAMLYGIDTRDRDRKGYLADKNRYQPWSGAPMEGELTLEFQGRDITIRRGPKGNTPFGAFSAVYTGTEDPVPGLTATNCGLMLTGVGREVFERSAFIGSGGSLTVTAAPELEQRIAALVSSGEEDVSFSQTEARLREWLNRRKVNRSVGIIPKLEGELDQVQATLSQLEELGTEISWLEGKRAELAAERAQLAADRETHRRLAQKELNRRCAQAGSELEAAQQQLSNLEREAGKYGALPDKDALKRAQGELQYLKVLDEEIRQGETALKEADEAYVQAQIAAQDDRFTGLSGEEATEQVNRQLRAEEQSRTQAAAWKRRGWLSLALTAVILLCLQFIFASWGGWRPAAWWFSYGLPLLAVALFLLGLYCLSRGKRGAKDIGVVFARYQVQSQEELTALLQDYRARCQAAEEAARQAKTIRGALNDRKARREHSRADLLDFVHTFAPQATDLFGCSAALSRALNLDHDLALAKERVEERRRRREDLTAQGGKDYDTLELLHPPALSPAETDRALSVATARLDRVTQDLNQALGRRDALGDPIALCARREELEEALSRRRQEQEALTLAIQTLNEANAQLRERFSPSLNRLAGSYMARLTGEEYASVTLTRELEGAAARPDDVSPRSVLYLSRGTTDQLYLAVRLAVCQLCLPDKPPIMLDDALAAFDDRRLELALELLEELAETQQVLLFTCQSREGQALQRRGLPATLRTL